MWREIQTHSKVVLTNSKTYCMKKMKLAKMEKLYQNNGKTSINRMIGSQIHVHGSLKATPKSWQKQHVENLNTFLRTSNETICQEHLPDDHQISSVECPRILIMCFNFLMGHLPTAYFFPSIKPWRGLSRRRPDQVVSGSPNVIEY